MASLRLPFVVTVGISTLACGGSVSVEPDDGAGNQGGTGNQGAGGAGTGNQGGAGNTTSNGGFGNVGGNGPACPPAAPGPYQQCDEGSECSYGVSCESGVVELTFLCENTQWALAPTPCDKPYDHCAGTEYYCDEQWWMPTATNPPSPCPPELPAAGTECFVGGMGGVWENCGYSTSDDCWIVATCTSPGPGMQTTWQTDGVCLPE